MAMMKKDKEMKDPVDLQRYYMLSKYGVLPSEDILPFREQIIKSTRIDKNNGIVTYFVNLPREYDKQNRPLCFETIIVKNGVSDCHLERFHTIEEAEKKHVELAHSLKGS
jgi:hypothetical protein